MELSEKEINELYNFVESKSIVFYDLQTELVDHLADDIENMMSKDTNITFNEAKQTAYKKFGVYGFSDILCDKRTLLTKKYRRILFKHVKEWFQLPKIILTAGLTYLFYMLLFKEHAISIFCGIQFCLFLIMMLKFFVYQKKQKRNTHQKKWLLEDVIHKSSLIFFSLLLVNVLNMFNSPFFEKILLMHPISTGQKYYLLAIAMFQTLCVIYFVLAVFVVPKKSKEILTAFYPNYQTN